MCGCGKVQDEDSDLVGGGKLSEQLKYASPTPVGGSLAPEVLNMARTSDEKLVSSSSFITVMKCKAVAKTLDNVCSPRSFCNGVITHHGLCCMCVDPHMKAAAPSLVGQWDFR